MDALHAEVHRGHRCSSRTLIWTRSPRGKKGGSDTDTDKGGSGYSLGEKELSAGCTLPEVNIAAVGTDQQGVALSCSQVLVKLGQRLELGQMFMNYAEMDLETPAVSHTLNSSCNQFSQQG